ncbi:MAG TPA: DUF4203 domain-containing protein [Nocardioides sp.]|nr:DUF4203 domain-containing protein [Nocardioides sp.]
MTAAMFVLLGLFLCFVGAASIRFAILVAGFCGAWLVADALDADTGTTFLVAAAGAAGALVLSIVLARFALFAAGLVLGGAVGAKLFEVLDQGDSSWLLAVVFVPSVALVSGFLAQRWRRPFLVWATAFAGAAMVLTGVGLVDTDPTAALRHPDDVVSGVALTVLWVALGLAGRTVQVRRLD